jgi:stearoyl-CoA desaturase (delta-9 desaturase)
MDEVELPEDMFETDPILAVRTLVKTISLVVLGYLFTVFMPSMFAPFGVFLIGVAMSLLYLVGYECSHLAFFKSRLANLITREIAWFPLLESVEGDVFGYWAIRIIPCLLAVTLGLYFEMESLFWGLLKFWVLPLLVMHMNIRQMLRKKDRTMAVLFPELAQGSYGALVDLLNRVPCYKIDRALELLHPSSIHTPSPGTSPSVTRPFYDIVAAMVDGACNLLPSRYFMCELLYWRKRDVLVEVVLAITVALVPMHYYGIVSSMAFCLPFLIFMAGFATNSKATSYINGWSFFSGFVHAKESVVRAVQDLKAYSSNLNWFNVIYLGIVHIWAVVGLFTALPITMWQTVVFSITLHLFYGLGITAGAHRLWSHKSYDASFPVKVFLMMCNSGANQGSIYHWSRDHRVHHRYSDTEKDPHNSGYGFFFSHCGWLFLKKSPLVLNAGRKMDLTDLENDSVVMFQRKYYPILAILFCFVIPTLIPVLLWNEAFFTSLTVAYIRYAVLLNATWCVNSVAHFFGNRPYRPDAPPAENFFVAIVAIGEGWHNFHHAYPWDYATSEFGVSSQFNPSKMFIDICAKMGWVYNRKRADHMAKESRRRNAAVASS